MLVKSDVLKQRLHAGEEDALGNSRDDLSQDDHDLRRWDSHRTQFLSELWA